MSEIEPEIQVAETAPERPAWLPSNFESPEDLAKSYSHATKKITEQGQALSTLQSQIEEIQAQSLERVERGQNDDIQAQILDALDSGDARAQAGAIAYMAELAAQKALENYKPEAPAHIAEDRAALAHQELSARYSDWAEVSPEIGRLVQEDPGILSVTAQTPLKDVVKQLDRAYKLAKYEKGQSATTDASQSLEELARQVKNQAQTMTGSSSATEAETDWDRIKAARSGMPRFG